MAKLSPMMQHYVNTKSQHPDAILFYRLGDFYEMFFEDAITVSRELELTLTGKECGLKERAPMAGVPWHSADSYIAKLIEKGYKVAICEQVEDPAKAKGLVKREVVRIITPGTVTDANSLDEKRNNYLYSVFMSGKRGALAGADISTGEFFVRPIENGLEGLKSVLSAEKPGEIITCDKDMLFNITSSHVEELDNKYFGLRNAKELMQQFGVSSLDSIGLTDDMPSQIKVRGRLYITLEKRRK